MNGYIKEITLIALCILTACGSDSDSALETTNIDPVEDGNQGDAGSTEKGVPEDGGEKHMFLMVTGQEEMSRYPFLGLPEDSKEDLGANEDWFVQQGLSDFVWERTTIWDESSYLQQGTETEQNVSGNWVPLDMSLMADRRYFTVAALYAKRFEETHPKNHYLHIVEHPGPESVEAPYLMEPNDLCEDQSSTDRARLGFPASGQTWHPVEMDLWSEYYRSSWCSIFQTEPPAEQVGYDYQSWGFWWAYEDFYRRPLLALEDPASLIREVTGAEPLGAVPPSISVDLAAIWFTQGHRDAWSNLAEKIEPPTADEYASDLSAVFDGFAEVSSEREILAPDHIFVVALPPWTEADTRRTQLVSSGDTPVWECATLPEDERDIEAETRFALVREAQHQVTERPAYDTLDNRTLVETSVEDWPVDEFECADQGTVQYGDASEGNLNTAFLERGSELLVEFSLSTLTQ